MDEIELTKLFMELAECNKKAEQLKKEIEVAVLETGKTTKIAGVTATYYKPSHETPDYESAACDVIPEDFDYTPFSTITRSVRWKEICEHYAIDVPEGKEKPAKVIIK